LLPTTGVSDDLLPIGLLAGGATLARVMAIISATLRRRNRVSVADPAAR